MKEIGYENDSNGADQAQEQAPKETRKKKGNQNVTQKTFRLRLNYPRERRIYESFEKLEGVSDTKIIIEALDLYFRNQSEKAVLDQMGETLEKIQSLQESMSYLVKRTENELKKKTAHSEYL